MAEVLVKFEATLAGEGGTTYAARACGRPEDDGKRWEGWIEFIAEPSGTVLRTPRETVQPNRQDLHYWATGLTIAYLEGALRRALEPAAPARRSEPLHPAFDGPAPRNGSQRMSATRETPRAVLDPFHVFAQGEDVLRQELSALEPSHLRNIIRAYDLAPDDAAELQSLAEPSLIAMIADGVQRRSARA